MKHLKKILVLALVLSPLAALAQTTTDEDGFKSIQEQYREKVQEVRDRIEQDREQRATSTLATSTDQERLGEEPEQDRDEARNRVIALRRERVNALGTRLAINLSAALDRLERFISRVNFVLETQNATTTPPAGEATSTLAEAQTLIDKARVEVNDLPGAIASSTSGTTTPATFSTIKDSVFNVINLIKEAQAKIVEAIKQLED